MIREKPDGRGHGAVERANRVGWELPHDTVGAGIPPLAMLLAAAVVGCVASVEVVEPGAVLPPAEARVEDSSPRAPPDADPAEPAVAPGSAAVGCTVAPESAPAATPGPPPEPMVLADERQNTEEFSTDGRLLVTGHDHGEARLWNVETVKALRIYPGWRYGGVRAVALSLDSKRLAVASVTGVVRVLDAESGGELGRIAITGAWPACLAFDRSGDTLAIGSDDEVIRLWTVGGAPRKLLGHPLGTAQLSFGDNLLAGTGRDGVVRVWDAKTAALVRTIPLGTDMNADAEFSPDGRKLAVADAHQILLYDVGTWAQSWRATLVSEFPRIVFTPDGGVLLVGERLLTEAWNVATGRPIDPPGPGDAVAEIEEPPESPSPDGIRVVTGTRRRIDRSRVSVAFDVDVARGHLGEEGAPPIDRVALGPDGAFLVVGRSRAIEMIDLGLGQRVAEVGGQGGPLQALALSVDGALLATVREDGDVAVRVATTGEKRVSLAIGPRQAAAVALSSDGSMVATGSKNGAVELWDSATGKRVRALVRHARAVTGVAFDRTGALLATSSRDRRAHLYTLPGGRATKVLEGHAGVVNGVALSPDGTVAATGSADRTVRLWDTATGRETKVLQGHEAEVVAVAFAAGGEVLASGARDGTVRLWDVSSGDRIALLEGHTRPLTGLSASADGRWLASSSEDATVRLWDASERRLALTVALFQNATAAFTPEGRYRLDGQLEGRFWYVAGLRRYEPEDAAERLPGLHRVVGDEPLRLSPPRSPGVDAPDRHSQGTKTP